MHLSYVYLDPLKHRHFIQPYIVTLILICIIFIYIYRDFNLKSNIKKNPCANTTTIRHTAVRETGASWFLADPSNPLRTSRRYGTHEGPQLAPHYAASRTAEGEMPVRQMSGFTPHFFFTRLKKNPIHCPRHERKYNLISV